MSSGAMSEAFALQWQEIVVRPLMECYPTILTAMLCFFLIQFASGWACRLLRPAAWKHLSLNNQTDEWCVRNVSTAHCFVAWTLVPGFFRLPPVLTADLYGFDPWVQTVMCISVGYFLWDLVICCYYRWPPAYFCHCLCCLFVTFSGLYPFLHHHARYFVGFFELSTPWLNFYKQCQICERTEGVAYTVLGLAFALSFTVFRIFIGIPYSMLWWGQMYELYFSDRAHSRVVIVLFVVSNVLLNGVNLMWWSGIIQMATRRLGGSTKTRVE